MLFPKTKKVTLHLKLHILYAFYVSIWNSFSSPKNLPYSHSLGFQLVSEHGDLDWDWFSKVRLRFCSKRKYFF